MKRKIAPVFRIIRLTFKGFKKDRCGQFAITISYFALLCAIPLAAIFAFVTTKIIGSSEPAFRSLNIFSDEFFIRLDPAFFDRVQDISLHFSDLGWFGLIGSFVGASFLFSNLIHAVNFIFKANYQKAFLYNRLMEYLIMFIIGIILLASLFITAIWTALHRSLAESAFIADHVNPDLISLIDNFFLQYLLPFALAFLVFFAIYKFIPEVKVYTKSAVLAALIASFLWEAFKRIFAFYIAHFSVIGAVLHRFVKGTLTSIIFFLLWITISLCILFWGAELAFVLNERQHEKVIR
ncbi:MAG: YihY/virulence factor BrkB family protein [Candidatus Aminicenantes bacterium]|nr:YihY/virulence factor BrkB family protein [Candidatus Aminicenantes bacterium]